MSSDAKPHNAAGTSHLGDCRASVPASAVGPDLSLRLHHRGEELPVPAARLHDEMVRRRLVAAPRYLAAALSLARGRRDRHVSRAHLRHPRRRGASRAQFFGRETISLLFVLPIALPASSPAFRCARPSTSWASISRSGPSFSATPPSASWWSTTTPSPGSGGSQATSSRRRWISAPTAFRPSVTSSCRKSALRFSPAACLPSRCRSTRLS